MSARGGVEEPALGGLSGVKLSAVGRLVATASDQTLARLELAIGAAPARDATDRALHGVIRAAAEDRRARDRLLAPLKPLFAPPGEGEARLALPPTLPSALWRALQADQPGLAEAAAWAGGAPREPGAPPPGAYDEASAAMAAGLRGREGAFGPVVETLLRGPTDPSVVALLLDIAPILRRAVARLEDWRQKPVGEQGAALRLAFRDATAVSEEAGPLFFEALAAHLAEPWQVLRLISAVMERPTDGYLAASELAGFGERALADVDARVEAVRRFDPDRGAAAGAQAARSVLSAAAEIAEFEQWFQFGRESAWGRRLAGQKRALALAVEGRLREVEPAVRAALPTQSARLAGRLFRRMPGLAHDPDPAAVTRAQALTALLDESRSSAAFGGFSAVRSKVIAALAGQLDAYIEELLDALHEAGPEAAPRIHAYLDVAAHLFGRVKDQGAEHIVRRRMAAA